jgi:3-mercaptopyruvate sulfurtransferase SseA
VDEATSARAALMLKERGVKNVRALRGGWNVWTSGGNPIIKGER